MFLSEITYIQVLFMAYIFSIMLEVKKLGVYFCFLLFSLSVVGLGQSVVNINGYVETTEGKIDEIEVRLYQENKLINSKKVHYKQRFSFDLERNQLYTLEAHHAGYLPKRMAIYTDMAEEVKVEHQYRFIMTLIRIPDSVNVDASELDFPVTIIRYSDKDHKFDYIEKYTKEMDKLQNLIVKEVDSELEKMEADEKKGIKKAKHMGGSRKSLN